MNALCFLPRGWSSETVVEEAGPKGPINFEMVDELATKLKALSVQIGELGEDYKSVAIDASDASDKFVQHLGKLTAKSRLRSSKDPASPKSTLSLIMNNG